MDKNVHGNHRERIREKFRRVGFEGWCEHEILEMLLFYVIPRADTNPIAHELIKKFGSLSRVLDADTDSLAKVSGVGREVAVYLSALGKLQAEYAKSKWTREKPVILTSNDAGLFCVDYVGNEPEEALAVICMDSRCSVVNARIISRGLYDKVEISIRKIVEIAFNSDAKYLILCHNHPSGITNPSQQDIDMTNEIASALKPLNIELYDHIVVGGRHFESMAERGYIKN